MSRALFWAERGRGRTSPNPIVGAVVVTPEGIVVGQGAHMVAGGPHAEVVALDAAGSRAEGATLYCTLEPCSHTGRTGPCTERIVAAGIARVVVAVEDANPRVSGRGLTLLRSRGVDVTTGVGETRALGQLAPFFTWIRARRPHVTIKAATSRDGYVGRATERVKITGPVADRYFQRQRAEIDALAVGSTTVLVDDPLLTARGAYRARPLVRVIVDWRGRVPPSARVFSTLAVGPVIMVVLDAARAERPDHFRALTDLGVQIEPFDSRDLRRVLGRLAELDVVSLLVEGGPTLQAAFAEAELVDRAQWVIAPGELGSGVPAMTGVVSSAGPRRTRRLGDDLLIEFDVHGIDRSHRAH